MKTARKIGSSPVMRDPRQSASSRDSSEPSRGIVGYKSSLNHHHEKLELCDFLDETWRTYIMEVTEPQPPNPKQLVSVLPTNLISFHHTVESKVESPCSPSKLIERSSQIHPILWRIYNSNLMIFYLEHLTQYFYLYLHQIPQVSLISYYYSNYLHSYRPIFVV